MLDIASMVTQVANLARNFLPPQVQTLIQSVPEIAAVARSVGPLVKSVTGFATGPEKADLDRFEAEVMAGLDDTIDRLAG